MTMLFPTEAPLRSHSRRYWSAVAIFGAQLVGCTSWKIQNVPPQDAINGRQLYQVRLTRPDSSQLVLFRPRIVGDSLIGERSDSGGPNQPPARVALPLSSIQSVAVRRPDATRTTLLLVGVGAAVGGVIAAMDDPPPTFFPELAK